MKRLIFIVFIVVAAAVMASCQTAGGYSLEAEGKAGIPITDADGNGGFCVYDQKVTHDYFTQATTCSLNVKIGDAIYSCSKLQFANIKKDFRIVYDCEMVYRIPEDEAEKNELTHFRLTNKTKEPELIAQNFITNNRGKRDLTDWKNQGQASSFNFAALPHDWG